MTVALGGAGNVQVFRGKVRLQQRSRELVARQLVFPVEVDLAGEAAVEVVLEVTMGDWRVVRSWSWFIVLGSLEEANAPGARPALLVLVRVQFCVVGAALECLAAERAFEAVGLTEAAGGVFGTRN